MNARKLILISLLALALPAPGQEANPQAKVRELYEAGRWADVVGATEDLAHQPAELDFYRGMALARLDRMDEARAAFEDGAKKNPRDKRFPTELAGVAFRQKRPDGAKAYLRQALRMDPRDAYVNDFLATLYFLDGNLPGALKYWNRTGKPRTREIKTDPKLRTDPQLLDRAFVCAPASVLSLGDYEATTRRLETLSVFPSFRLDLIPSPEPQSHEYDLNLTAVERHGLGNTRLQDLAAVLGGVPFQGVAANFYNLKHAAMNLQTLARWDSKKRRAFLAFSAPLGGEPNWRYRLYVDARNEDWNVTRTFLGAPGQLSLFALKSVEAGGDVLDVVNSRFTWRSGAAISRRIFSAGTLSDPALQEYFTNSNALEVRSGLDYVVWRLPEQRFTLGTFASARWGRAYARNLGGYEGLNGGVTAHWFPQARGDDYEISEEFRAGHMFGRFPFDKLYILGLERDNDLPLRAHIGTAHGKKGSAPLGRAYFLSNWEINKNLYDAGWFRVRIAPFLDAGRAYDSTGQFGSRHWLWDTGGELKGELHSGLGLVLTFGKDLRTGRGTFYATLERRPGASFQY